ncbi:MAG: phosphoglycerate dehydrogenase [Myxococcales bacterium]|nr:phosphoglycerate dehydrogenase [Myxococcales bacterium]
MLENIHRSAYAAFEDAGVEVHARATGLNEEALINALASIPGDAPLMVGIRSKTHVTERVLDAVPRLHAIGAFCIGTDQISLSGARDRGVVVFNAPFSNTRSVAELMIGEIIMLARHVFMRSAACHRGEWRKSAKGSHEVRGKTLGIVGYGHIGSQLSVLAEALGMHVIFYDIVNKLPLGNARACGSLDELLAASDFVSLHVPDTSLTRGMMGAAELAKMRRGASLLNASRGLVVDVDALRAALDEGRLSGAAIDVYPKEPKGEGQSFESVLRGCERAILTPHIGGSTEEAQANIGREVSIALAGYLRAGVTVGAKNLPQVDAPDWDGGCRISNIHRNVPGVLSAINNVVSGSGINVAGQHLATMESVGVLIVDLCIPRDDPRARGLRAAIAELSTSLRTRLL